MLIWCVHARGVFLRIVGIRGGGRGRAHEEACNVRARRSVTHAISASRVHSTEERHTRARVEGCTRNAARERGDK